MITVQDKMNMTQLLPYKKNDSKMNKRLGGSNNEIKYLGRSNQKIKRRLR